MKHYRKKFDSLMKKLVKRYHDDPVREVQLANKSKKKKRIKKIAFIA